MRNLIPLVTLSKKMEEFYTKQTANDNEMTDVFMLLVLGCLLVAIYWEMYKNPVYLF